MASDPASINDNLQNPPTAAPTGGLINGHNYEALSRHWEAEAKRLSAQSKTRGEEIKQLKESAAKVPQLEKDNAALRLKGNKSDWSAAATKAGIDPAKAEDALTLSGLKLDEDLDPKKVEDAIKDLKKSRKWLFKPTQEGESGEGEGESESEPANPAESLAFDGEPILRAPSLGRTSGNSPANPKYRLADTANPALVMSKPPGYFKGLIQ